VTDPPGTSARPARPAVIVWVAEGTWHASIDAARHLAPPDAEIVLLHVTPQEIPGAAHGAYAGLLGRGHPERDPGNRVAELATASAADLLNAAAHRLARPCTRTQRQGRPEREVTAAAESADLLIVARDGDRTRAGPKSLAPASRFVVDHAPCPVLLVWPGPPPAGGLPPAPPHPPPDRPGRVT
jgi:nucleotide-binding universal stress UspA family protein